MTALAAEEKVTEIETVISIAVTVTLQPADKLVYDDGDPRPPHLLSELELEGLVAAVFTQGGTPFDGDALMDLDGSETDYQFEFIDIC